MAIRSNRSVQIGYSDYGDVYLKRCGNTIYLKRYTPVDYEYMEDYIDDNHDMRWEWQEDVWNWNTESGYDERRQNYEYDYDEYFCYDSDTDEYYDEWDNDFLLYNWGINWRTREEMIDTIMESFEDDFDTWGFEYSSMNDNRFREIIWEYYDECVAWEEERIEAQKPHWNAFNYYK